MPHDRNGRPLKIGDVVTMSFRVDSVRPAPGGPVLSLDALPNPAVKCYLPWVTCNPALVELVELSAPLPDVPGPVTDPANPSGDAESPCFNLPAAGGG